MDLEQKNSEVEPSETVAPEVEPLEVAAAEASSNGEALTEEENSETANASGSKEMPVSALVRLMGMPTSGQIDLLEKQLGSLLGRLDQVNNRLNSVEEHVRSLSNTSFYDRVDFQLSEVKSILKRLLPEVVTTVVEDKGAAKSAAPKAPEIMTSAPLTEEASPSAVNGAAGQTSEDVTTEESKVAPDAEESAEQAAEEGEAAEEVAGSDDFQTQEAQRVREEMEAAHKSKAEAAAEQEAAGESASEGAN